MPESMPVRFYNHVVLAFRSDPKGSVAAKEYEHKPALLEWMGNGLVWPTYRAPVHIKDVITNPKVLTVFFTMVALYGNTFAFYPTKTAEITRKILNRAKEMIPQLKFPAYCLVSSQIVGLGARSYGRFSNFELMHAFDSTGYPKKDVAEEADD